MEKILRGQYGLNRDGIIRNDPWFLIKDGQVVQTGFGEPPAGYTIGKLPEGLILPGLVNSHTHLELSIFKGKTTVGQGVHNFATSFMNFPEPDFNDRLNCAIFELQKAISRGTFFFLDIGNHANFSRELENIADFQGRRFLEVLGFCSPADERRINTAKEAFALDDNVFITPHSIYGSSPAVFQFAAYQNRECMSIHCLEAASELNLFHETGLTYDFLIQIGQYKRYPELYGNTFVSYLASMIRTVKKILLVHMTFADKKIFSEIEAALPQSAIVLCNRSNEYLSYRRENWDCLEKTFLPLLLGTDSTASCPDISVIDELLSLFTLDVLPQSTLWKAASYNAYSYLDLNMQTIPYFWYEGATPDPLSLSGIKGINIKNLPAVFK